jgi:hypothetical protein
MTGGNPVLPPQAVRIDTSAREAARVMYLIEKCF